MKFVAAVLLIATCQATKLEVDRGSCYFPASHAIRYKRENGRPHPEGRPNPAWCCNYYSNSYA